MLTKTNQNFIKQSYSFLLMVLLLTLLATPALAKPQEVGKILMATVGVTAQQPGQKARPLARRSAVFLGDTLKTPEGGRAQLRMADGEMLSLTASSELTLEAFDYQPDNQDSKDTNVKRLVTGGLRTITGAVKGDGYEMKNRAGTIGIRGTAFEVYSQQGENLFVRIQRGNVFVANAQGSVDIGVNQGLMAARIGGINQAPEGISLSDLPQFFEDAFAEDTTLSLATGGEQQQASQQNQISEESYSQPTAPAMALQVAQTAVVDNFDDTERDLERFKEASKQKENTPETPGPVIPPDNQDPEIPTPDHIYSGYVVNLNLDDLNLSIPSNPDYKVGGFFNKSIIRKGSEFDIDFSNEDNISVLELELLDKFNFSKMEQIKELGIDSFINEIELWDPNFDEHGLWFKYGLDLEDEAIIVGLHLVKDEVNNTILYNYLFSDNVIEYDDLNKIKDLLGSNDFTYTLGFSLNDIVRDGELVANFSDNSIIINLNNMLDNNWEWTGSGNFKDFYNSSIRLTKDNDHGAITGRFVGNKAQGVITTYQLGNMSGSYSVGTAIFERVE